MTSQGTQNSGGNSWAAFTAEQSGEFLTFDPSTNRPQGCRDARVGMPQHPWRLCSQGFKLCLGGTSTHCPYSRVQPDSKSRLQTSSQTMRSAPSDDVCGRHREPSCVPLHSEKLDLNVNAQDPSWEFVVLSTSKLTG